jgi:hypothetical protein
VSTGRSLGGPPLQLPDPLEAQSPRTLLSRQAAIALPCGQRRIACECIIRGRDEVRTVWGTIQEAAALLDVLCVFVHSTVHEVGLCMLDPEQWGFLQDELPPVGSSPDGLIYHPACEWCGTGAVGVDAGHEGVNTCTEQARVGEKCDYCNSWALPGQWEVVEVKNHCPFVAGVRTLRLLIACPHSLALCTTPQTAVSAGSRANLQHSSMHI